MFQSLTVLAKKLFVVVYTVCFAKFNFKAARVVSCKLGYNVPVLVVFDGPWSDKPLVPDYFLVPDRND